MKYGWYVLRVEKRGGKQSKRYKVERSRKGKGAVKKWKKKLKGKERKGKEEKEGKDRATSWLPCGVHLGGDLDCRGPDSRHAITFGKVKGKRERQRREGERPGRKRGSGVKS